MMISPSKKNIKNHFFRSLRRSKMLFFEIVVNEKLNCGYPTEWGYYSRKSGKDYSTCRLFSRSTCSTLTPAPGAPSLWQTMTKIRQRFICCFSSLRTLHENYYGRSWEVRREEDPTALRRPWVPTQRILIGCWNFPNHMNEVWNQESACHESGWQKECGKDGQPQEQPLDPALERYSSHIIIIWNECVGVPILL